MVCAEVLSSFSQKTIKTIIKIFIVVSISVSTLFICFPIVSKTIDAQKLTDPVRLLPTVNTIDKKEKIIIRQDDWFVFSSMFLFYGDRGNVTLNNDEFENKISDEQKYYFASYKDDFMTKLLNKYQDKIKILAETKKTILFTNKND